MTDTSQQVEVALTRSAIGNIRTSADAASPKDQRSYRDEITTVSLYDSHCYSMLPQISAHWAIYMQLIDFVDFLKPDKIP